MINNQELTVPFNKESAKTGLAVCFFAILALFFFLLLSPGLKNIFGHYITLFIQSILVLGISLFLIGLISAIFLIKKVEPLARLNKDGIWVQYFGFIPWHQIDEFKEYSYKDSPIIAIGIRVKDLKALSKQASLGGKMGVFWSKIFGYPPIQLTSLAIDNEQIISFAQRFLDQQS